MKLISLYSGSGGLDYGFKKMGFKTIFANDIDKDSCETFYNFLKIKSHCDDLGLIINKLPKSDILIGGPPCQSFSLLGKRREDDPRGKEVFNFLKAVSKAKPKAILFENVPGISASKINNLQLTEYIKKELEKQNYFTKLHKFICTEYFIPQTRVRYIIFAWKKNLKEPIIYKNEILKKVLKINTEKKESLIIDALGDLSNPVTKGNVAKYKHNPKSFLQKFARKNYKGEIHDHFKFKMSKKDLLYVKYIKPGGNYWHIPDDMSSQRILRIKKLGGRTTTYGRLHPKKFSATVNTYFNRPNVGTNYHYSQKRLITPREAMRIQSFPDNFIPTYKSIRSLCRQIGNAVPPLLSIALAASIKSIFRK